MALKTDTRREVIDSVFSCGKALAGPLPPRPRSFSDRIEEIKDHPM